ncbi:DUF6415 family natural product biosynthesis protein [Streptomyces sp. NPDC046909]|uniref:DUF6415 family natural product biosynthesis protein n=1 Tax=Streptomyces sp. NPDC046909 TaxID=3155617 RepID=UPI0033FD137B
MTAIAKICAEQAVSLSWLDGPLHELPSNSDAVLATFASEPAFLASQTGCRRDVTEQSLAPDASLSEDPDERYNQILLMRGYLMTLLGAARPAHEGDRASDQSELVVRVRALLGVEIPGDAVRAAALHRDMDKAVRELLTSLPDNDGRHEATGPRALTVPAGFDSTRIREASRTAKSWKQARVYPHPRTLAAVTHALSGHITALVPYVTIYSEFLATESPAQITCCGAIERAQEARDAPVGEGLVAASEHAFRLAVHVEVLLQYAEQYREQSGERHASV